MSIVKKILLPTEFSIVCETARDHAVALAKRHDAELHLLHVQILHAERYDWADPTRIGALDAEISEEAARKAEAFAAAIDLPTVNATRRALSAAPGILEYAKEHDIDLIVMGTHGRGAVARFFLGSEAMEVVRMAPMPVLVVGPDQAAPESGYDNVVAAVDFSAASNRAMQQADRIAHHYQGKLALLHVVDTRPLPPYETDTFEQLRRENAHKALEKLVDESDFATDPGLVIATGKPYQCINEAASELQAKLLVMGSRGLHGLDLYLLGSVAERVIRSAPCPVLSHRGKESLVL